MGVVTGLLGVVVRISTYYLSTPLVSVLFVTASLLFVHFSRSCSSTF